MIQKFISSFLLIQRKQRVKSCNFPKQNISIKINGVVHLCRLICSFIHMRAFPITAAGLAEEAIDGDIVVVTDSVKDVAYKEILNKINPI